MHVCVCVSVCYYYYFPCYWVCVVGCVRACVHFVYVICRRICNCWIENERNLRPTDFDVIYVVIYEIMNTYRHLTFTKSGLERQEQFLQNRPQCPHRSSSCIPVKCTAWKTLYTHPAVRVLIQFGLDQGRFFKGARRRRMGSAFHMPCNQWSTWSKYFIISHTHRNTDAQEHRHRNTHNHSY